MPVTLTELPIEELVSRESETLAREFEGRVAVDEVYRRMQETVTRSSRPASSCSCRSWPSA